jgi:hypothetical protein
MPVWRFNTQALEVTKEQKIMLRFISTTILLLLFLVGHSILAGNLTASPQNIEVIFYKLEIDSEPFRVEASSRFDQCEICKLTDEETQYLKNKGLTGKLEFRSSGRMGNELGKRSRVLIIMYRQPSSVEIIKLPQPDGCSLIYLQTENGWDKFPKDAPTSKLVITLSTRPENPSQTIYYADLATGGRSGGGAISW